MKTIKKWLAIRLIKYLQRKYKAITVKNIHHSQSNQVLNKLRLIQSILYYFKGEFHAWGYFHPNCDWSKEDEKFFNNLFPQKAKKGDKGYFEEMDLVVEYNPEAVTYYKNKIYSNAFKLGNGRTVIHIDYAREIEAQLIKWKNWN